MGYRLTDLYFSEACLLYQYAGRFMNIMYATLRSGLPHYPIYKPERVYGQYDI